ncbi:DeoR/GlpR family DNA-binding transcription regulator [Zhihengliuella flava]|uniref:Lactose phosphotransferase system repressor n=1 Tax=Zhihengliuella flava TaxID=1285193 RepID=A0A931D997_9MICC|nr:DeoR/GlpR family DNA-binding transcription regulator [Zhihengliuella flava]MBG6084358.1 DeoR family fructose operon transcriptional repressor [Zhihengliuella flava]
MFAEERHQLIAALVAEHGKVTVADLAARFSITRETVRRDLAQLERTGTLRRVHGGAVASTSASTTEQSHVTRTTLHADAKQRIADAALDVLPSGDVSVVLDAGTTTELFASALAHTASNRAGELLAITHALPVAARLGAAEEFQLEIVGGRVRGLTSAAIGPRVVEHYAALRPDIAFVGTNGLSAGFGLSTPDDLEAAVKTAIVDSARRVVVLADSSKFGAEALVRFAALDAVDTVITDAAPGGELATALEAAEVEVVLA